MNPAMPAIKDALYYPNIHIENANWLKATLLCFPHIYRMTPKEFVLRDDDFVRTLVKANGRENRPLVDRYDLNDRPSYRASETLLEKIRADLEKGEDLKKRFSREATVREYRNDSVFQIHQSKISEALQDIVRRQELAWVPEESKTVGEPVIAVHPKFGGAIMSTIAASIAKAKGLEIVTSDMPVHHVVATNDYTAIYDTIVNGKEVQPPEGDFVSGRLAQLVIVNHFDLEKLSADDLIGMSREGEALYEFRTKVGEMATRIPPMEDDQRRENEMKLLAEEIVEKWKQTKATMSKFAKQFFGFGLLDKSEKSLGELVKTAGIGGSGGVLSAAVLGVVPGLAVGVVIYGLKTWHSVHQEPETGPFRFLTKVQKRGATLLVSPPPAVAQAH